MSEANPSGTPLFLTDSELKRYPDSIFTLIVRFPSARASTSTENVIHEVGITPEWLLAISRFYDTGRWPNLTLYRYASKLVSLDPNLSHAMDLIQICDYLGLPPPSAETYGRDSDSEEELDEEEEFYDDEFAWRRYNAEKKPRLYTKKYNTSYPNKSPENRKRYRSHNKCPENFYDY